MVIKNKKAWLRIFEAVIAIVLVMGAALLIYSNQRKTITEEKYIQDWQVEILKRIAENDTLRDAIVDNQSSPVRDFIELNKLNNINFSIKICEINGICLMDSYVDSVVFVQERIISGTIEKYGPKKVRFFVWRK